jgi:hypothetical protein
MYRWERLQDLLYIPLWGGAEIRSCHSNMAGGRTDVNVVAGFFRVDELCNLYVTETSGEMDRTCSRHGIGEKCLHRFGETEGKKHFGS